MTASPASIDDDDELLEENRSPHKREHNAPQQVAALTPCERAAAGEGQKPETAQQVDAGDDERQRRREQQASRQENEPECRNREISEDTERVA